MILTNNLLLEGVKDDAIAIAKKMRKENSSDFKKLMQMLDKDRGLMVVFTKWLLGIPTGPKDELKKMQSKAQQMFGERRPQRGGPRQPRAGAPIPPEGDIPTELEMPRMETFFSRIRPVPLSDLDHLYTQAKEFGLANFKKNFNEFKSAEEFGDYITREHGDKKVKDALSKSFYDGNKKRFVGIPHQIKKKILETPKLFNLFRNNIEQIDFLADFVARKGMRSDNPNEYESKVSVDQLHNAITQKLEELEDFSRPSTINKIKKFNLKAHVIEDVKADYMLLMYVEDVTASANLGSQEWCIAQAEGFGFRHEKEAANKENVNKPKKATSTAASHFNNTYSLSKFKKCYFLYDFSRDHSDLLRKICFIVNGNGELEGGWDAADTAINKSSYGMNVEELIHKHFPELDQ